MQNTGSNKFERIWCDGIEAPVIHDQSLKDFEEMREIVTGAWIGITGQDKYKMTIRLGNQSFDKCLKGLSLYECLPDNQSSDWIDIDIENKEIVLRLL